MSFRIIVIGKIKEPYLKEGIAEYKKRINPWIKTEIIELKESKKNLKAEALREEGDRILKNLRTDSYVIVLTPEGKKYTSPETASKIELLLKEGQSDLDFVIGGHEGLSGEIKKRADLQLSLSEMTFSSRLSRLVLMEQLFRCMKIIKNEPYHR